jgi:hypothetical protein
MCTSIVEVVGADGAGKGGDGWFDLTHSVVSYDHPHHALLEEAITIDFVNSALGPGARVAVELTLEAAKELSGALARAIAAAEIEESARLRKTVNIAQKSATPSVKSLSSIGGIRLLLFRPTGS